MLLGTIWKSRSFARSFTRFPYPTLDWDNTLCSWNPPPNQLHPTDPHFLFAKMERGSINARKIEGSRGWSVSHHSTTDLIFRSHRTRFDTPTSSHTLRTGRSTLNGIQRSINEMVGPFLPPGVVNGSPELECQLPPNRVYPTTCLEERGDRAYG